MAWALCTHYLAHFFLLTSRNPNLMLVHYPIVNCVQYTHCRSIETIFTARYVIGVRGCQYTMVQVGHIALCWTLLTGVTCQGQGSLLLFSEEEEFSYTSVGEPLRLHAREGNCDPMPFKEKAWSTGENVTKHHQRPLVLYRLNGRLQIHHRTKSCLT